MAAIIARNIIFPAPLLLANKNKYYVNSGRYNLLNYYHANEVDIPTKDGIKLNGIFIQRENSFSNFFKKRKLYIYFPGNAEAYEHLNFLEINRIRQLGFDILLFNFRGVAKSEGSATVDGLINDGIAVLDFSKNTLKYKEEKIVVRGKSLGAALAAKSIAENRSKVSFISDRSFSSIKAVIDTFKTYGFFKWILKIFLDFSGWDISVLNDFKKIEGKKCIIYAPDDEIILPNASLYKALEKSSNIANEKVLTLPKRIFHNDALAADEFKAAFQMVN
ncbi:MAG: hypothetical protein JXA94_06670 [Parachlamydiales bacterium]|nr:hypothetical protein [Parachlamydiales bacterium]